MAVKNDPGDRKALLQQALQAIDDLRARLADHERRQREPIAIVGMGCRFPGGVESPEELWALLRDGVDAIADVPADRWDADAYYDPRPGTPGRMITRQGGFLRTVDQFDPVFFGISPREAVTMDPQQRLLLETTWEALEHGGIAPPSLAGSDTGVFVGITTTDYRDVIGVGRPEQADVYAATGNALNAASGRLAFVLGLQGPCASLDTACSSSLVAVHQAVQSLRTGECGLALAGGVNVVLRPQAAVLFSQWGMLAPDGRCKTFDARADGFVRSEGCAVLVLERLSDAVARGHRVLAVVRGSAVVQDGHSSGLTVPNGLAQQKVIARALASAGLTPDAIDYVEAHGTGTPIGDPIEVEALAAALGRGRSATHPLLIGSIKTNIGHAEAASGVAGLMKVALALQHEAMPPHLHFEQPNPRLAWERLPLRVPTSLAPWPRGARPRLAGVSSFGFSGTNAHVILEEAPPAPDRGAVAPGERPQHLLVVSARTRAALQASCARLSAYLERQADVPVADVGHTLAVGRAHFEHRAAIVAADRLEALGKLRRVAAGTGDEIRVGEVPPNATPRVAFLFTGQGSQYAGMTRALYETAPTFRAVIDECDATMRDLRGASLIDVLYPPAGQPSPIDETEWTQPALFAVEYGLAMLWREWGVLPAIVLGHSVGEYVAAAVAGALTTADALRLIEARARLMQALPAGGGMLAVMADEASATRAIAPFGERLSLAAVNGPREVVVAGELPALAELAAALRRDDVKTKPLTVSHAFHSPLMQPMLAGFEAVARTVSARQPAIPLVSNLTGDVLDRQTPLDAAYWTRHVRQPVRFHDSVRSVAGRGVTAFVEIGPAPILSALVRQALPDRDVPVLASLRKGRDEWTTMLDALASLYVLGMPIDWEGFDRGRTRRLCALPTYPFQRSRHWAEVAADAATRRQAALIRCAVDGSWLLQSAVSSEDPEVADHTALGTSLYPASGYVRLVWQAMSMRHPARAVVIDDLVLHEPLTVDAGSSRQIQVVLASAGEGETFKVFGQDPARSDSPWTLHASGRVTTTEPRTQTLDLTRRRAECPAAEEPDAFYERVARGGIQYGPSYRLATEIHRGDGRSWIRLTLPAGRDPDWPTTPMAFDAVFQSVAAAAAPTSGSEAAIDEMWVPVAFGRIHIEPALWRAGRCWAAASLAASGETGIMQGDVVACGDGGEVLLSIEQLSARRISRDALRRSLGRGVDDLLYTIEWREAPVPAAAVQGRWVVVGGVDAPAGAVARALSEAGCAVSHVTDVHSCLAHPPVADAIVDLRALDPIVADDPAAQAEGRVAGMIELARLAGRMSESGAEAQVTIVTRGACGVDRDELTDPVQTAIWGSARAARAERPDGGWRLVDLDPGASDEALVEPILVELADRDGAEPEVAWRSGQRSVPRLQRWTSRQPELTVPDEPYELRLTTRGRIDQIELGPAEPPVCGPDDVEIEVTVSSLNFRDVLNVLGMYPGDPGRVGSEFVGRVRKAGANASGLKRGDRVMAIADRAFSSVVVARAELVWPVPEAMTDEAAATIPNAYLTAAHALHEVARIAPGERVLVHAAAGGVGMAAVHLARAAGAEVFATAGSERKRAWLKALGVRHVMDSRSPDFAVEIRAITAGEGVDVVINSLTGPLIDASLSVLRPGGRFVELGKTDLRDSASVSACRPGVSYTVMDLGEVFRAEPSAARRGYERVMHLMSTGTVSPLPTTRFSMQRVREAFRFMAQARHIGKVVVGHDPAAGRFRRDASYVITGGLGDLGLATARWMAERGAGHLVLVGRSEPKPEALATLDAIRAPGTTVEVAQVDVADREALLALLDAPREAGPIRGIVHAAGVLADAALQTVTPADVRTAFAPKGAGAWHLHEWARRASLDFFVCYGAGAGLLGSAGQLAYAAANAFLDGLAQRRRAEGLPALSIDWGAWADIGMAARASRTVRRQWASAGVGEIAPAQALLALERTMAAGDSQVAIMAVDWAALSEQGTRPALARDLQAAIEVIEQSDRRSSTSEDRGPWLAATLEQTPSADRSVVLHEHLQAQVRRVLGLSDGADIHPDRGLMDLGMDSLMAVELRNRLQAVLGRPVPATVAFEHPTIEALGRYVLGLLGLDGEGTAPMGQPAADVSDTDIEQALLSELDRAGY